MAEYQFDPATGSANEVSHGSNESTDTPTSIEEINRHRVKQTAIGLTNRGNNTSTAGDTGNVELEIQLQQSQQKLMRGEFNGPLEEQQLIQQTEFLAAQLVGVEDAPRLLDDGDDTTEPENFDEEYINSNPEVKADLQYASEVMSEELVGSFNNLISDGDELTKVAALDTLKTLRKNPQAFASASESTGIDSYTEQQIAGQYGDDLAHAISVLGNGVAQGVISSTQAIKTASQDPDLMRALYSLSQQGVIKIAL